MLAAFGLLALLADAAASEEPKVGGLAGFRFLLENDAFARGGDRAYTGGFELEWRFSGPAAGNDGRSLVERAVRRWCAGRAAKSDGPCGSEIALGVAQQAYTPKDLSFAGPQPWDRPWAGHLFVSSSIALETVSRYHALEGHLGIIGPESGARYVQIQGHELIKDVRPAGWDQQIQNQLALEAIYTFRRRFVLRPVELIVGGEGSIGTVRVHGAAGGTVRFGRDLAGFGKSRIAPSVPDPSAPEGWFVFATIEERLILFDTFLAGGTFRRVDTDVRAKRTRTDASVGFALPLSRSRRCSMAYEVIFAGAEFDGDERHRYGSIVLSCAPSARDR